MPEKLTKEQIADINKYLSLLKNIEKNLYQNNNYKRLKNLIALDDKHL